MQFKSTLIIGAGGTGQQLIPPLVRLLKYHSHGCEDVTIYDGDAFEDHNIERQVASTGDKAAIINDILKQQGLSADCRPRYVSRLILEKYLERYNETDGAVLVIAAVDNDASRKMIIETLEASTTDFLFVTPGNSDAADAETSIKGNVLWFGREDGKTIGISPTILFPNIERPTDAIPRRGGCIEQAPSTPQLITANALAAALTLAVIQNFLDELMPFEASHCFFNGRSFQLTAN